MRSKLAPMVSSISATRSPRLRRTPRCLLQLSSPTRTHPAWTRTSERRCSASGHYAGVTPGGRPPCCGHRTAPGHPRGGSSAAAGERTGDALTGEHRPVGRAAVHHHQGTVAGDADLRVRLRQRHVLRRQGDQVPHRLAGTGRRAPADQHDAVDRDPLAGVEGQHPARRTPVAATTGDRRTVRPASGAPTGGGAGTGGGPGWGAAVAGGGAATAGGRDARRGAAGVAGCGGAGTSRMAVRFTTCRGPLSGSSGALGSGRRSTTIERATWSCHPRRRRVGSATAVQASVASPMPNVGRVATPSTSPGAAPGRTRSASRSRRARPGPRPRPCPASYRPHPARRRTPPTPPPPRRRPARRRPRAVVAPEELVRRPARGRDQGPGDQPVDHERVEAAVEARDGKARGRAVQDVAHRASASALTPDRPGWSRRRRGR